MFIQHVRYGGGRTVSSCASVVDRFTKSVASTGVTRIEIGNLFDNFKPDVLGSLSSQLDALQTKKKKEE